MVKKLLGSVPLLAEFSTGSETASIPWLMADKAWAASDRAWAASGWVRASAALLKHVALREGRSCDLAAGLGRRGDMFWCIYYKIGFEL